MREEMEHLLLDFVEFYNLLREDENSPEVKDALMVFARDYYALLSRGASIYSMLDEELGDDVQLHILVLSALFLVDKREETLNRIGELLYSEGLPLDAALRILAQTVINRFFSGFPAAEYCGARRLHRHLLGRLERELSLPVVWIPCEERNQGLIVLESDTLIDGHAPSQILLDIYKTLKEDLGYEVVLLVDYLSVNQYNMEDYWVLPYRTRYSPRLDGEFSINYRGVEVRGFQQVVRENDLASIKNALEKIRELKPEFVWHIGGQSVLSDFLALAVPLVSMPCTDGYIISEAPVLVSYMQNDRERAGIIRDYMERRGQRYVDIQILSEFRDSGREYGNEDFGIPEDGFAVAIVGNRLDTEISREFMDIMKRILEREPKVYFLLIGKSDRDWSGGIFQGRVVCLGFCEDLYNVLGGTRLFLNPVRQGGSGGAARALAAGVPVLTLGDCDVAWAGEDFICGSLEEYPEMVSRYCHDQAFYESQSRRALEAFRSGEVNPGEECERVIRCVREWQEQEA